MSLDFVVAEDEVFAGRRRRRASHATRRVLRAAEASAIGERDTGRLVGTGQLRRDRQVRPVRRAPAAVEMKAEQVVAPELHRGQRATLDVRDGTTNRAQRLARRGIESSVGTGAGEAVGVADGPHLGRVPSAGVVTESRNAGGHCCDEDAAKDRVRRRIPQPSGLRSEATRDHVLFVVVEPNVEGVVESYDPAPEDRSLASDVPAVQSAVLRRKVPLVVRARRHFQGGLHQHLRRGANAATGERQRAQQPRRAARREFEVGHCLPTVMLPQVEPERNRVELPRDAKR